MPNINSSPVIRLLVLSNQNENVATALQVLSGGDTRIGYEIVESRAQFLNALHQQRWDVLLADYSIPDFTPLNVLRYLRVMKVTLPVIALGQNSDEAQIVEAMRSGASDFVTRANWARLLPAIGRALQKNAVTGEPVTSQADDYSVEYNFRRFEQEFRYLLDAGQTSLLAWDARSEQITFHYNFESIFGEPYPSQENGVAYLLARLHNEDRDRLQNSRYEELVSKDTFLFEGRVIWPDDSTQWLRANGRLFYDEERNIRCVIILAQNVTGEKQAISEIKLSDREPAVLDFEIEKVRAMDRLHRRFMMMAAHEIRTPLTIISTANELLYEHYDQLSVEAHREYLQEIRDQIRSMRDMLTEIESIARDEYIVKDFSPLPTDIVELARELLQEIFEFDGKMNKITFENRMRDPIQVIDRRLVGHILSQLLQNAVKFSSPGGTVKLVATDEIEDVVQFSVIDHGIGIPVEDLPHIYDAFVRGSNVGAIAGRGIGLKIVQDCVHLHQGRIDVVTTLHEGTQFTVTLPTQV
jgi:signal transduction histidine kinase/CheY-like chemotaxis protein